MAQHFPDLPGILRRCQANEEAAWEEFCSCLRRVTIGVLSRFQNLTPIERELAGEQARAHILDAALEGRIEGATNGQLLRFLRTVVINCARDVWRQRHPMETLPDNLRDRNPSPAEAAATRAQLNCVRKIMQSWTPDNRFIFLMKLNRVSAAGIKTDLERIFHVAIGTEAIDTRFHRLREELRRRCGSHR